MQTSVRHRVAAEVRAEIARQRLTQQQVGERMGKPQWWVSRRLTGRTEITASELVLLAEALGVPVSAFLSPSERVA